MLRPVHHDPLLGLQRASWLVPGDGHLGTHDRRAWDLMLRFAEDWRPCAAVLQGDTWEGSSLANVASGHRISARHVAALPFLRREAEIGRPCLERLVAATVKRRVLLLPGNHDGGRYMKLVDAVPALHGERWWSPWRTGIPPGVRPLDTHELVLGPLTIVHGDRLPGAGRKHSSSAVITENPAQNTLYGHTHRIGSTVVTTWRGGRPREYGAWNVGHLQDIREVDYTDRMNWRLGFAVVRFWRHSAREVLFNVTQHEILRVGRGLVLYSPLTDKEYTT